MIRALTPVCVALALVALRAAAAAPPPTPADQAGKAIYRSGLLPNGALLHAEREAGIIVQGADAACINCHKRSALGAKEGRGHIPPIAGPYLFEARDATAGGPSVPYVEGIRTNRAPYTDATLARAIRTGIDSDGRPMSYLMPHFELDDTSMAILIDYLKRQTAAPSPGVTADVLHFATIFTPDADPVKRDGVLNVLQQYFDDHNAVVRGVSPPLHSARPMMFRVLRHWELHVWDLKGAPDTWEAQLQEKLAAQPVFAVLSGLGGRTWAPVHAFCEHESLPCLFPNVELPVDAERDFYSLYFSRGVLLEAQLIAHDLEATSSERRPARLIQLYRSGDVGEDAARALRRAVGGISIEVVDRPLQAHGSEKAIAAALHDVRSEDSVVLWLRTGDVRALAPIAPASARVYFSALLGGLENTPMPEAWRPVSHLAYGFDLPDKRIVRVDYPRGWFRLRHIPVVDLQLQSDTYLACGLLAETLKHMTDAFIRDYLIEQFEAMIEHRVITGYYPRLTLAPGQRFASKGGYVVHFTEPTGTRIAPDSEWIVP